MGGGGVGRRGRWPGQGRFLEVVAGRLGGGRRPRGGVVRIARAHPSHPHPALLGGQAAALYIAVTYPLQATPEQAAALYIAVTYPLHNRYIPLHTVTGDGGGGRGPLHRLHRPRVRERSRRCVLVPPPPVSRRIRSRCIRRPIRNRPTRRTRVAPKPVKPPALPPSPLTPLPSTRSAEPRRANSRGKVRKPRSRPLDLGHDLRGFSP